MGFSVGGFVDSIFPGVGSAIFGGGQQQSGDSSGAAAAAEEARKAALRRKIDLLYGIAPAGSKPVYSAPPSKGLGGVIDEAGRENALEAGMAYDADAKTAAEAAKELEGEKTQLSDATRSYYTDQLAKQYANAERNLRFSYARSGLLGGSAFADSMGELRTDRDQGSTRIDEAVRRAITGLTSQREQERLSAINLVNSGSGDDAVTAAQRGIHNAFDNANSAQKADLFGNLFAGSADAVTAANNAAQAGALASRYRNQLSTFFPASSSGSGRITPGG